ncbi:hypothetical protein [Ideonella sp. YS5]|uniref:hypothetical protein n=1 Tax=Ideonella sp. YS5 TaxID=3453714 RepID=UPI003EEE4507
MAEVHPSFEREHGCTEADWLRDLPGAVGLHRLLLPCPGEAEVVLEDGGTLSLRWQPLPDRRIALIRLPRMQVRYAFSDAVPAEARAAFMRLFDLHMRRGGG